MKLPLQIQFRNLPHSDAIEANIREKAAKLELFYHQIMSCNVVVEAPHKHQHKGHLYHVRIDITAPQGELVINRDAGKDAAHEDVYVAIRDAFNAARRKLQDYGQRQHGEVKVHEEAITPARVWKLFPEEGYGFIETHDGREIYFHRNSVLNGGFDHLKSGTTVSFIEEQGDEGPQASSVKPLG